MLIRHLLNFLRQNITVKLVKLSVRYLPTFYLSLLLSKWCCSLCSLKSYVTFVLLDVKLEDYLTLVVFRALQLYLTCIFKDQMPFRVHHVDSVSVIFCVLEWCKNHFRSPENSFNSLTLIDLDSLVLHRLFTLTSGLNRLCWGFFG